MKAKVKTLVKKHPKITSLLLSTVNRFIGRNSKIIKGNNNKLLIESALLKNVNIKIIGNHNVVKISKFTRLSNCNIIIIGDNNIINIGEFTINNNVNFNIEDDGNKIYIGEKTALYGEVDLSAIEGTIIQIGRDCLFSSDIDFRTGDSHTILDSDNKRINPSKNIIIGNHVWIGTRSLVLKGSEISNNTIVGAGSLVNKRFDEPNVTIAGMPAQIVKRNTNWLRERIK